MENFRLSGRKNSHPRAQGLLILQQSQSARALLKALTPCERTPSRSLTRTSASRSGIDEPRRVTW